ncbi:hypothetical protein [Xenorhabdus thailandensis]|uniref:hypothetical protein n=1 Tax=Xenorhabdus thailandensis TaxID=3136255 RepID=UPI0030F43332
MNKYIQSSFDLLSNIRIFNLSTHNPDEDSAWSQYQDDKRIQVPLSELIYPPKS